MADQSRIKFNPVTKEIEIEGSEQFVKTYFDKVQAMLVGKRKAIAEAPIEEKPAKKARASKKRQTEAMKKGVMTNIVLDLILSSPEGITTADLKEKTGFEERQIWGIVTRAKKLSKIKQGKRGLYVAKKQT